MVRFNGESAKLSESAQVVSSVVSANPANPILANIKLVAHDDSGAVDLCATDYDIRIQLRTSGLSVERGGEVLLNATQLTKTLSEISGNSINFVYETPLAIIRAGKFCAQLNSAPVENYPELREAAVESFFQIKHQDFKEMLENVAFAVGSEHSRFTLHGIYLVVKPDQVEMVTSDGHRLALMRRRGEFKVDDQQTAIVPLRLMKTIERMLSPSDKFVEIGITENELTARTSMGIVTGRLAEGIFPDYTQVIPKNLPHRVILDRKAFYSSMRKMGILFDEMSTSVSLTFTKGELRLRCFSEESGVNTDELPIEYDGEEVKIEFVGNFLIDVLRVSKDETIVFEFQDEETGGIFKTAAGLVYMVMPLSSKER
ncbi:MAG: DNA polymerase III subunit beta [Planctomycetes bacterium]|nr:DNA polymerase III subunit beta [Planctomycetota bacterium]